MFYICSCILYFWSMPDRACEAFLAQGNDKNSSKSRGVGLLEVPNCGDSAQAV